MATLNCCFWNFDSSISCQNEWKNMSGRVKYNEYDEPTFKQFESLGVFVKKKGSSYEDLMTSEKDLIKMRLCIDKDNLTVHSLYICVAHRYKLGIDWRINEKRPH